MLLGKRKILVTHYVTKLMHIEKHSYEYKTWHILNFLGYLMFALNL